MNDQPHERYETLLVKAVDGLLTADEQRQLQAHLERCADCRAELRDFKQIKQETDAMRDRILMDARIEPPRETRRLGAYLGLAFMLLLAGGLVLLGFAAHRLLTDPQVPLLVKLGLGLAGLGGALLLAHLIRVRLRGLGKDPYREIDR
jgi:anti-sigma factor RsiW